MSLIFQNMVLVGVPVPSEWGEVETRTHTYTCECGEVVLLEGQRFCSFCGKRVGSRTYDIRVWGEIPEVLANFAKQTERNEMSYEENHSLWPTAHVKPWGHNDPHEFLGVFVGLFDRNRSDSMSLTQEELRGTFAQAREDLKTLGIEDEPELHFLPSYV